MVIHHQILSSQIPSPPLNTDLDCHCFLLFQLILISLFSTSFTSVIALFLLAIASFLWIISRILGSKRVYSFMREYFSFIRQNNSLIKQLGKLIRKNFFLIKHCKELIRENFSLIKHCKELIRKNFSLIKQFWELIRENFSLIKWNKDWNRENLVWSKEFQLFLAFGLTKSSIISSEGLIRNLHCNYRERLNRPAR